MEPAKIFLPPDSAYTRNAENTTKRARLGKPGRHGNTTQLYLLAGVRSCNVLVTTCAYEFIRHLLDIHLSQLVLKQERPPYGSRTPKCSSQSRV